MPAEPRWLTPEEVVAINRTQVAETGEPFALRDRGLLESACARPAHKWHYDSDADLVDLTVSLALGIAGNHPFRQGNKRTGLVAAIVFVELNGFRWTMPDDEALGVWLEAALERRLDEKALAERMRPYVEQA